ncbi:BCCT family transporter [Lachnospiraceae bacterium WCA-9-b2]|uniref:BCCT family transporter n=1 Tax=Sporofaciens musculi TaxID=2681861 RepID=A0A7X3ME50_9FIRM|nr:BCCT family transporter [Sporofaciens musculi]MXP74779.1 BCCT family transporter [Sporofaciens musculi]
MGRLDLRRFLPTVMVILIVLIMVATNLSNVQSLVDSIYTFMSGQFGWLFILANLSAFLFSLWIIFSPKGKIRLGGEKCKPAFNIFSWIAMMFTTSCSAGLIVFGFIEAIIYASAPPFQIEPFSVQAYEYAEMYSHYHWGFNAWTLYVPASIAIGYALYNKRQSSISISDACEPILGKHSRGTSGVVVDVLGVFGAVVAPVTSMGLGMPLLTLLFQEIFSIGEEYKAFLQIIILFIWILIFGTSTYLGLSKGIKNLSNINILLAFIFMLFVGGLSGILYVVKAEINTLGLYIQNFIRMATFTDPYGDGSFVSSWTVWYWAWLIVYMPLMGVFNARISKGRTLRELAVGQMVFCSLGCWVAMSMLGNHAIKLQQSGVDVAKILNYEGQPEGILLILQNMPMPKLMMAIVAILCFMFMATTVDSSSFVAAEITTKHETEDDQAPRWIRVFWAAIACIITFVLLQVGGFNAVQVLAILIGLPLAIVMFIVIISAIKLVSSESL